LNDKIEKKYFFKKIQSKKIAIKTIITKSDKENKNQRMVKLLKKFNF